MSEPQRDCSLCDGDGFVDLGPSTKTCPCWEVAAVEQRAEAAEAALSELKGVIKDYVSLTPWASKEKRSEVWRRLEAILEGNQ